MNNEGSKLLSISVAAYNVEKYLNNTIDSIISSEFLEYIEVIIVNDGSKDSTINISKEYENQYEKSVIVIDKENGGHGSTINAGVTSATGKYFMVLDGDDWVDTKELDGLLKYLQNAQCDMVLMNSTNCYENGKKEKVIHFPTYKYDKIYDEKDFGPDLHVGISCAVIKTQLLKESGLRCVEHCYYEDLQYDAYITYLANNFEYKNFYVYQYRLGLEGQSVSIKSFQKNIDMQFKIEKVLCEFYGRLDENISAEKKESVLNCWVSIEKSIIATLFSFSPSKTNKKRLADHVRVIKKYDVDKPLCTQSVLYKVYRKTYLYYPVSFIYSKLKK